MRWIFVGAGNMASSLVGGLRERGAAADSIGIVEPDAGRREAAVERYGVAAFGSIDEAAAAEAASDSGVDAGKAGIDDTASSRCGIVIAVKPDIVEGVCREIGAARSFAQAPVLSVAAGVRMASIDGWLGGDRAVLRCIPNTPALVGLGATALVANGRCPPSARDAARELLESVSLVVELDDEALIDAATALSGSGPAYVFRFIEHLVAGGVELGLDRDAATALAVRTVQGAAAMAAEGSASPATLRENVTSKGGTTAAALASFEHDDLGTMVLRAMHAARSRAAELGAPAEHDDATPAPPASPSSS